MIDNEQDVTAKEITDDGDSLFTVSIPYSEPVQVVSSAADEEQNSETKDDKTVDDKPTENTKDNIDDDIDHDQHEAKQLKFKKNNKETGWKEARKTYEKARELEMENEGLRKALATTLEYGKVHHQNNIDIRVEQALQKKKAALAIGDADALTASDLELFEAIQTKREINNWEKQRQYQDNVATEQESRVQPPLQDIILYQWLQNNPELNIHSPFFDQSLADEVLPLVRGLDSQLKESDQADWICTPEYYNYLQSQVNGIKGKERKVTAKVSYSTKHIGGVKSTPVGGNTSKEAVMLTPEQKEIAALYNISPEVYLKRYNQAERERTGKQ